MGKKRTHAELALEFIAKANNHITAIQNSEWMDMKNADEASVAHFRSSVKAVNQAINALIAAVKGGDEDDPYDD
jgi:hypothetical protein